MERLIGVKTKALAGVLAVMPWGCVVLLLALLTACRDGAPSLSLSRPSTPEEIGAVIVEPLQGAAKTNQAQTVERVRHLTKKAAWEKRTYAHPKSKETLRYLLFKPANVGAGTNLPLVLSLHGGAPRHHFEDLLEPYLPGLAYGLGRLVSDEIQQKYPSFVLAPWSNGRNWDDANIHLTLEVLDSLAREFHIDTNRIYVTGQSMGGFGTWTMITQHPQRFAAAIPICGGGTPGDAARAKDVPIWAFHGTADNVVPVTHTREMIAALRKAGGHPLYWEYVGADHSGTAERAYSEPDLMDWLFTKTKR
jgi:predicted peptidase